MTNDEIPKFDHRYLPNALRRNWTTTLQACYSICVGKEEKLYQHILMRRSDANVPFDGLCALLMSLGFDERIRGGHHIFTKAGIEEILNLQSKGGRSKPYQVKQVRDIILKYKLRLGD